MLINWGCAHSEMCKKNNTIKTSHEISSTNWVAPFMSSLFCVFIIYYSVSDQQFDRQWFLIWIRVLTIFWILRGAKVDQLFFMALPRSLDITIMLIFHLDDDYSSKDKLVVWQEEALIWSTLRTPLWSSKMRYQCENDPTRRPVATKRKSLNFIKSSHMSDSK